jgi:hypothetical protein
VRFSSGTAGSFSKSIAISSNGGNATVTATGVAHKVSFSPAPLDFGSGLLVMREQCNNMGACGLRTEKVGLPIEKALTVKNEGTVSVSLTLSTTAPYKVVSVLPTLSPGQSAQVTLRFDPSESGTFTGNVQVGINGGQGSVKAPLVGTAHKIELNPAELNFGLVFVGSTRERKLTVKNQGVTTVTLEVPNTTQNTASPFRIMLESPLVLSPSESTGVPVQFSATASGTFSENVQLVAGSVSFKVPVRAWAITYEEYLQALLTGANTLARYGGAYNVLIAESWQSPCLHTFAGFDSLSAELIQGYMDGTDCEEGAPDIDLARLEELKRASELMDIVDIERLNTWLRTLKGAFVEGRFDEEYERLLPEGLDQFMEAFRLILGLSNIRANELKDWLKGFLQVLDQQNPVDYAKERQAAARAFLVKTYGENHYFVQFFDQRIVPLWNQVIGHLGAMPPSFGDERNNFSRAMYWIIVRCDACFNSLANVLAAMNTETTITQNLGTILSIGHAAYQGWLVRGFEWVYSRITRTGVWAARLTLPYDKANALGLGGLFGQREGPGRVYEIRGIQAIVIGNHCDQCASWGGQIAEWVFEALRRYGFDFTTGGSEPGRGNLNVVVISFTRNNAQGIEGPGGVIEQLGTDPWIASSGAVVMIVYIKDGQVKWACISRGCDYLTDEEKEAIAKSFANLLSKYPSGMIETLMGFCGGDAGCVISLLMAGK